MIVFIFKSACAGLTHTHYETNLYFSKVQFNQLRNDNQGSGKSIHYFINP